MTAPATPANTDVDVRRAGPSTSPGRAVGALLALPVVIVAAAAFFAASLSPAAAVAAGASGLIADLFDFPPLVDDLAEPWERSVITDRDGNQLAVIREENRKTVDLDAVPEHVQDAVLATEDAEFREHEGVNWAAIGRAAFSNVQAGEITAGGSTITQQLIKNVALSGEQTLQRKLQEAVYAIELESRLSKDEILEAYLNEAYFGNRVYGVATAAEFYFSKDVGDLEVEEGALLAGIIRAPGANDPLTNPEHALARRNIVLAQMARVGWLDDDEARALADEPLDLDVQPLPEPQQPFFVDYVHELLLDEPALGDDRDDRRRRVRQAGLEIRTTLHPDLQELAHAVIADYLDPDEGHPDGVLTTVDPRSGEVLAIGVGPREYGDGEGQTQVNPAAARLGGSGRQSGSAFKPFVLATALEEGLSPGHVHEGGAEYEFENLSCPPDYAPGNYGGAMHDSMDMTQATAISSNVYFAHLLDEVGPGPLVDVTERLGVPLPRRTEIINGPQCSVALGTEDVFPLAMASAFGVFATSGERCEPHAILEIRDRDGEVITTGGDACEQVVSPEVADRTTFLLRQPIESGTASQHGQIGRPAAGKTGTTSDHVDAWFVGYVPQLATASWVGHDQPAEMTDPRCGGGVTGGCLPTMIWADYMQQAVEVLDLEPEEFPDPPPIPQTTVPEVVGEEEDDAVDELADASLTHSIDVLEHWAPEGIVVDQTPEPDSRVDEGSQVALDVSDGSGEVPVMPDFVGAHRDQVEEWAEAFDITADVDEVPVGISAAYDHVLDQAPEPGTPLFVDLEQERVLVVVGRPATEDDPGVETGLPGLPEPGRDDEDDEDDEDHEDHEDHE